MVLTSRELVFKRWMFFSACMYGLGGLGFALFPLVATNWIQDQPTATITTTSVANPMVLASTAAYFWNALAVAMMSTIFLASLRAWRDPVGAAGYAFVIVVAKFTACGMAILTFVLDPGNTAHTIPMVIVLSDLPLGLVTLWTLTMAKRSRAAAEREDAAAAA